MVLKIMIIGTKGIIKLVAYVFKVIQSTIPGKNRDREVVMIE